jgi:hypothetical protein
VDDVFLFLPSHVSLEDLAGFVESLGYEVEQLTGPYRGTGILSVRLGPDDFSLWDPVDPEADLSLDDEARKLVRSWRPSTTFVVSLHMIAWPRLRSLLRSVLERYGGRVGSDGEALAPVFTAETIAASTHPTYEEALGVAKSSPKAGENGQT